jgi:phage baseplate assembly protein W
MNIAFPFHFDALGRTASCAGDDHIRHMIEMLLFTSPGERVNRPDFGCGLLRLVFEPNSPDIAAALQFTVQAGLERWLGDLIEIRELGVRSEDSRLTISLNYVVRRTGDERTAEFERPSS